jgi:5-methylcytosine-specific restriction endonuclease McrA
MTQRIKASIKGGALFKAEMRVDFLTVTASRYGSMRDRLKRKKLPPPPFTLEQFRADVLGVMGGKKDGAIQCRYCLGWFTIGQIAVDHATPLSRGGSLELSNLDYPCSACNDRKGSLLLEEYKTLLRTLDNFHPSARQDVLGRLEKANKLAAGLRRSIVLAKASERKVPALKQPALDYELGEF